ncbi:MAG: hypothetical protein HFJ37_00200 [Clostridia bacterium]|nr:hypothetical protein [Clostridia bacterium]
MKELKNLITLKKINSEDTSEFVNTFLRLTEEKTPFTLEWRFDDKLYLFSLNKKDTTFICLEQAYNSLNVSVLNFTISLRNCEFNVISRKNELIFCIFSTENTIKKISNFFYSISSSE